MSDLLSSTLAIGTDRYTIDQYATRTGPAKRPVVVILHGVDGMVEESEKEVRRLADQIADDGYIVFVPHYLDPAPGSTTMPSREVMVQRSMQVTPTGPVSLPPWTTRWRSRVRTSRVWELSACPWRRPRAVVRGIRGARQGQGGGRLLRAYRRPGHLCRRRPTAADAGLPQLRRRHRRPRNVERPDCGARAEGCDPRQRDLPGSPPTPSATTTRSVRAARLMSIHGRGRASGSTQVSPSDTVGKAQRLDKLREFASYP